MGTRLTISAIENSTYIVHAAFFDENSLAVVPDTITWTLTDTDGNVINSRHEVVFTPPDDEIDIILSGNDLALSGGIREERRILIEATYTSVLGPVLPLKMAAWFTVENLISVP